LALNQQFVKVDKAQHDLKRFDCGEPSMNEFLSRFAPKHADKGLSVTYVLPEQHKGQKAPVAAYYTLSTSSVQREQIQTDESLPRFPIPVVLLARLAVDKRYQGLGLGGKTLVTALRQAAALTSAGLPAHGLILDVLNESAQRFYEHYEIFAPFTDDPRRLFVPMGTIRQL
jgi:GNAT superfamily N-acetyltransferase